MKLDTYLIESFKGFHVLIRVKPDGTKENLGLAWWPEQKAELLLKKQSLETSSN